MKANKKIKVAVLFGGRSGEHEISLLSARSILSALDPDKYEVTQIGITHEGAWVTGENLLDRMSKGLTVQDIQELTPAAILPDPGQRGVYVVKSTEYRKILEKLSEVDLVFPILHGTFGEDGTVQGLFELAEVAYVGAGVAGSSVGMDKGIFHEVMRANNIPRVETMLVLRKEIEGRANTEPSTLGHSSPGPSPSKVEPSGHRLGTRVAAIRTNADSSPDG